MATKPIRVSERNMMKLTKLKMERGYASYDKVISKLLTDVNKKEKKKKHKNIRLFNAHEFGL